jgi:hypothetical protein
MPASVYFDHLAVGVRNRSEGFGRGPLAIRELDSGDAQVEPMPFDEATAVPVWLSADAGPGRGE